MPDSGQWPAVIQEFIASKQTEVARRQARRLEELGFVAGQMAADLDELLDLILSEASIAADILPAGDPAQPHLAQAVKNAQAARTLSGLLLGQVQGTGWSR